MRTSQQSWKQEQTTPGGIHDFPDEGGANPSVRAENLLFDKIFAKNCMKMKEIGPKRGGASLAHP